MYLKGDLSSILNFSVSLSNYFCDIFVHLSCINQTMLVVAPVLTFLKVKTTFPQNPLSLSCKRS